MVHLYKHFHDHIKKSRPESKISVDSKDWPEDWKTVYFKEYSRFSKIKLALPKRNISFNLFKALVDRKSDRNFSGKPFDIKKLAQLLIYGAGIQEKISGLKIKDWNLTKRTFPSGGARYPIELYPLVLQSTKELPAGIYHFNFKNNSLEQIEKTNSDDFTHIVSKLLVGDWPGASVIVLLSAVFDRTINKYQDFGYRLIWAECGHIGQNFYLVSEALGLKCCAVAGIEEDKANELLDLDGKEENVLMAYVFGS